MKTTTEMHPMHTIPGYYSSMPGIQIGTQLAEDADEEQLALARQLGIEWVMTTVHRLEDQNAAHYRQVVERFASYGLKIYRLANHSCHNMEAITLKLPNRQEKMDEYLAYIRNLGEAGIHYSTYAHMANGIWSTEAEEIRGGAMARALRLDKADSGYWIDKTWHTPLSHGRLYTCEELWDNYRWFMERVVPVAEDAGVYIGVHPDDPPVYPLAGIPRCIFGSFEGYRQALEFADSPNIGMCLCVGCWLEGGEQMGKSVTETIRYFGSRNRLFKVHFRNVTAPLPEGFRETFLDNGYCDMVDVMTALHEVGFDGAVISDHLPRQMAGGRTAAESYSIGYIRGLLQSIERRTDTRPC